MKKIIAILPIVIFLVSVAFASASLNINETNINATANPGATFSKQITLINTERNTKFEIRNPRLHTTCFGGQAKQIRSSRDEIRIKVAAVFEFGVSYLSRFLDSAHKRDSRLPSWRVQGGQAKSGTSSSQREEAGLLAIALKVFEIAFGCIYCSRGFIVR